MKTRIEVSSKQEGEQLNLALSDPTMRAANLVFAALKALDDRARRRVMTFIHDYYDDLESLELEKKIEGKAANGSGEHVTGS